MRRRIEGRACGGVKREGAGGHRHLEERLARAEDGAEDAARLDERRAAEHERQLREARRRLRREGVAPLGEKGPQRACSMAGRRGIGELRGG